jgi:hypothetical protein
MNDTKLNRGSWITMVASILLIVLVVLTNIYRYGLPTDGWSYIDEGGFDANILGLPSAIQSGDIPVSIEGVTIDGASIPRPETLRAGGSVQFEVTRGDETVALSIPMGNWNLTALGKEMLKGWSSFLVGIVYFLIGVFVFSRRPENTASQVLLFLGTVRLAMILVFIVPESYSERMFPLAITSVALLGYFVWGLLLFPTILLLSLVFPRPKWPYRTHPMLTLAAIYLTMPALIVLVGGPLSADGPTVGFGLVAVYGLLTVVSIVHTLITERRDPVARAQIQWVGFGVALVAGYQFLANASGFILQTDQTWPWWAEIIDAIIYLALPVTIGVAILRYRLWDIDLIVRRTLQYALLTGLLAMVYLGSVIVLQKIFENAAGEQSAISIVISTLIIAALFSPLRRRVQDVIDRRFYRSKYDASRTLARFAQTARDEVELEALTDELVHVVEETMRPESVWLWLRRDKA